LGDSSDLAAALGVSLRTIHRYFGMLDEMGVPQRHEIAWARRAVLVTFAAPDWTLRLRPGRGRRGG
jgi:predicted DNA-binding transcriptional regulator YafY